MNFQKLVISGENLFDSGISGELARENHQCNCQNEAVKWGWTEGCAGFLDFAKQES